VSFRTAAEAETLHNALKTFTDRSSLNIYNIAFCEKSSVHFLTDFKRSVFSHTELFEYLVRINTLFFEIAFSGAIDFLLFENLVKTELNGTVTVFFNGSFVNNYTWSSLDHCNWDESSVFGKYLRHPNFSSDYCSSHLHYPSTKVLSRRRHRQKARAS